MIYSYINTGENLKNSKLRENTPPLGRCASTQFLVFPISTRVDITVYQHGNILYFLNIMEIGLKVMFRKKINQKKTCHVPSYCVDKG